MNTTEAKIREGTHYKCRKCDKLFSKEKGKELEWFCDDCGRPISKFIWIAEHLNVSKSFKRETSCKEYLLDEITEALKKIPNHAMIKLSMEVSYKELFHKRLVDEWY